MSGLLRHKRTHISVSQCNLFQADHWLYVVEQILGKRGLSGVAAIRGQAVETAVTLGLVNPSVSISKCQDLAIAEFERSTALISSKSLEKERAAVPLIVEQALNGLRPYGVPSHVQHMVTWTHPDLPVPFKGYIDYIWDELGIIVDLKTQLALSSKIKSSHARQLALYGAAISDNYVLGVAYFTPKHGHVLSVENAKAHLNSLVCIAKTIDRFLDLSDDPYELLKLVIPDTESFYFADDELRQLAFELSGV